jgi:hypothetical protein
VKFQLFLTNRGKPMSKILLKATILSLAGGLSLLCAAAQADCAYPKAPAAIPDGAKSSEGEMAAAAATFKQYNSDVTAYLACLQDETAAKSAGASAGQALQIKSMQSRKHNSAVDELESNVAKFNAQLRAFKSKKA